ncbi:6-phosphogluconate dehydrogenase C-terminal domain-like protein [Xylona heveae TC161]|uniref:6-phosphogluconate dehydrogenase C-terminal domain-like protein n=1 Tax=Xylona heveae (strain CBS 132557 / TC161) TaxID=1328760 RepID=A0A165FSU5_XYLHT|nr:6-phosphogluconate dehydrogenase C-terminal domain-like protein [Xylona heveae TC161]KZF21333.1 6-phosphogluconate dehydrogenase C-terminal domain-like protein [Xylona heveae TC161]
MHAQTRPCIAIISFGTMGAPLARILIQQGYRVLTCLEGRSEKTKARAASVGVESLSISGIVQQATLILSIVPPADAMITAQSFAEAVKQVSTSCNPLPAYVDLNATSPPQSLAIADVITAAGLRYVDGGIIGFPPSELEDGTWKKPTVLISGPKLADCLSGNEEAATELATVLKVRHISDAIGAASGFKNCFASYYKGQVAITLQAFTTAQTLGCLPFLREMLHWHVPEVAPKLEAGVLNMQHKAFRWIHEMESISDTFHSNGLWSPDLFKGVGEVYQVVDQETDLGKHGKDTVEEVISEICAGLERRKLKAE